MLVSYPGFWESVYLRSNCMENQGLRNIVKTDKVDFRFKLQDYLYGTVY